ncbi:MAG: DUF6350 family protein [Actinomycetota bacterium]
MPDPDATSRLDRAPMGETAEVPLAPLKQPHRLIPYLEAAALAFLGLLALGAVLLVVAKLQYPRLGAGADPVEMLTSLVIVSLATLRVPVHVGELTFTLLPLGALAVIAWIVRWACRSTIDNPTLRRTLWVGPLFGLIAACAAFAFRHRFDTDPIYAGAPSALILGSLWVALFAAWFFVTRSQTTIAFVRGSLDAVRAKSRPLWESTMVAGIMLGASSILALAGGLFWVIVSLLRGGGPQQLDLGGLVAALVYVLAFAPNLVIAATTLSLGAPLRFGAGLTIGGRVRGNVRELSIAGADGVDPSILMVLVPLVAAGLAGAWVARTSEKPDAPLPVLVRGAALFAATLTALAWLGHARLGAQLASEKGFGVVAADAPSVFTMALLWSFLGALAGWAAVRQRHRSP